MSFRDRALVGVIETASKLDDEANNIGVFRSVDATVASQWLHHLATEMRKACDAYPGIPPIMKLHTDWVDQATAEEDAKFLECVSGPAFTADKE